ncbi:MAG TPA: MBL fold metallo-hydrolase [Actinomycetota bacterium]|nr:MBL fold metallo-hydrolase [Actinomycetota bacterium]
MTAQQPTQPRDAASVVLARASRGGYEILMTRRPDAMRFMGGMHVFPGGAVDVSDASDAVAEVSALSREDAASLLSEPPELALAILCCAVRELFEEAGILLARTREGQPVDPARVRDLFVPLRDEVAHDAVAFATFCRRERLVLATDRLVPHGRLVTPAISPIRFDARYFVTPLPDGQVVVADPGEVTETVWAQPAEAVRLGAEGRLNVPIPTMAILEALMQAPVLRDLLDGTFARGRVRVRRLSPLVSCVLAPNPGPMTGPGTNTYVVGDGGVVIVDPAVPDPVYVDAVVRRAREAGGCRMVLLTHLHPDHTQGAEVVAGQLDCAVGAWEGVAGAISYVTEALSDEQRIRAGGATLRALHTPGHASHHLCFLMEEESALLAGDVVAGAGTVVIAPPDGDMSDYLATLRRLRSLGLSRIYPGHGPTVDDPGAKLDEYIAHRLERETQVLDSLARGDTTIPRMVSRIYSEVPVHLHPVAELSVLAHLEMLEKAGRVRRQGEDWTPVTA